MLRLPRREQTGRAGSGSVPSFPSLAVHLPSASSTGLHRNRWTREEEEEEGGEWAREGAGLWLHSVPVAVGMMAGRPSEVAASGPRRAREEPRRRRAEASRLLQACFRKRAERGGPQPQLLQRRCLLPSGRLHMPQSRSRGDWAVRPSGYAIDLRTLPTESSAALPETEMGTVSVVCLLVPDIRESSIQHVSSSHET